MDDARLGRSFRAVRVSKGLRQEDVAAAAGVSQDSVSRVERGLVGGMTVDRIRAVGQAIGVVLDLTPRWGGAELDRLLGARHSALHEAVATRFARLPGWTAAPEVTFSIFGERGAIDVLGLARSHPDAPGHRAQDRGRRRPGAAGDAGPEALWNFMQSRIHGLLDKMKFIVGFT